MGHSAARAPAPAPCLRRNLALARPVSLGGTLCVCFFWKYRKSINCWHFFEHFRAVDYWGSC